MVKRKDYSIHRITAWFLLNQMDVSLMKYEDAEFNKIGLSLPKFIIAAVRYLQPSVTPTDFSQWLDRNLNTVTLVLDRIEKAGLVKRSRDLTNQRTLRLSLTPKSARLFAQTSTPSREITNDVMSCLTDDELRNCAYLTQKLRENMFEKLRIAELSPYRIETMNYILQEEGSSQKPIRIEPFQSNDTPQK